MNGLPLVVLVAHRDGVNSFHLCGNVGDGSRWLHVGRAGSTRGPAGVTREVRGERWRPAKAPAGPDDHH
jgi:hypothetical protein